MAALRIAIACTVLAALPRGADAAISLSVSQVGVVPPLTGLSRGVALGDDFVFDARPHGLFNFDGQSFAPVANPHGAHPVSIGLPLDGFAAGALEGVIFKGKYYFNAPTPNGTSLFRTDGHAIELVADFDPSNDTRQTIYNLIATDSSLFVSAQGQNGQALFRTDGSDIVELNITSGLDLIGIHDIRRLGNEIVFHGTSSTSPNQSGTYAAGEDGVRFLGGTSFTPSPKQLWNDRFYWTTDNKLYQYDGTNVTTILQLSGVERLSLQALNDEVLTLSGLGPQGWVIYTWDGSTAEEFFVGPIGNGSGPHVLGSFDGGIYYGWQGPNGDELYFTDGSTTTEYDILPGPDSSSPDIGTAKSVNGVVVFQAIGPKGKELYRVSNRTVELLADINPTGDAFPFTAGFGAVYKDELYFRAASPSTGSEIFKTDGETVSLVADAIPGPRTSNGNYQDQVYVIGDFPLAVFSVFFQGTVGGEELFATDGGSFVSIDAVVGLGSQGNRPSAGTITYGRDLLYFAESGEVYRVSVVPEPATLALFVASVVGLLRARRRSGASSIGLAA
jgi:ELWxxDGT repeat protein